MKILGGSFVRQVRRHFDFLERDFGFAAPRAAFYAHAEQSVTYSDGRREVDVHDAGDVKTLTVRVRGPAVSSTLEPEFGFYANRGERAALLAGYATQLRERAEELLDGGNPARATAEELLHG